MSRQTKFRVWDSLKQRFWDEDQLEETSVNLNTMQLLVLQFSDYTGVWYNPITDVELSQYTGLKDKNGSEIYEGYIIKDNLGFIAPIEFRDGQFIPYLDGYPFHEAWSEDVEVIGNIYENPELLDK